MGEFMAIVRIRLTNSPGIERTAPRHASSSETRPWRRSWQRSSGFSGHRNRSQAGLSTPTRSTRTTRCHTRRSIAAYTCRPAVRLRRNCSNTYGVNEPCVVRDITPKRRTTMAGFAKRCRSGSGLPRLRTGQYQGIGRETCYAAVVAARSLPWWSARLDISCWSRLTARTARRSSML